jgi:Putative bacterial sensory transduction regulator
LTKVAAVDVVADYLASLPGEVRRLAHGEWGLTIPAETLGGEPLDIGLRVADGVLSAKAAALGPAEELDPWMLLWWNRQTRHVRFGCTRSREIWVHADLPAASLDERQLDRLLGLVVEAVAAVRAHAADGRRVSSS